MVREIITIFCICDDFLKTINHKDDKQARMSTSEILTTAIVAAKFFSGNYNKSRCFLSEHSYITSMLSESRFIRRLNQIDRGVFQSLFSIMARTFKAANINNEYAIDSFPVPVCSNVRINRCKIYRDKEYHGYCASKGEYFYGIRVHMLVTRNGEPVEFIIEPGSVSDVVVARSFKFDLPKGAKVHADKGYTDYGFEDHLEFKQQIHLLVRRKENAKRKDRGICTKTRKIVESTFSAIFAAFSRTVHAITAFGFELKIALFIFAYSMKFM
jgi:Transposase DDE domain